VEQINAQPENGWTPLINATLQGHKEVVDLLLNSNANVNIRDDVRAAICTLMSPSIGVDCRGMGNNNNHNTGGLYSIDVCM
jgi:ankyrin repeat protein